jgi:hypothetical protein
LDVGGEDPVMFHDESYGTIPYLTPPCERRGDPELLL